MPTLKTIRTVDIKGEDDVSTTKDELKDKLMRQELGGCTIEGNWNEVVKLYQRDPNYCTIIINKSIGTALHVAVNEGNESVVRSLVDSILHHRNEVAFKKKNEKGYTPLHFAASRGFKEISECIIGKNGERKDLIYIDNNNGETPLFLAALSWQKQTFLYLFSVELDYKIDSDGKEYYSYSKFNRSNGDSILHCAISGEYFDLALIIMHRYPKLCGIPNNEGYTPLKLLATRPSAFESGCKMIWWKKILYHCIHVGNLNLDEALEYYDIKQDQENLCTSYPKNYETCLFFLRKCQEYAYQLLRIVRHLLGIANEPITTHIKHDWPDQQQQIKISMPSDRELLPENYATCHGFLKLAYIYILGLSGVGVHEVRKMKQKHKWCSQLLTIFMEYTYDSYYGANAKPPRSVSGTDSKTTYDPNKEDTLKNMCETWKSEDTKKSETLKSEDAKKSETSKSEEEKKADTLKAETLKSETPILTAARYGIVEMVNVLITKIPSSIYETNLENKNILLVAVENRRTVVVESLRKWFEECNKKEIFDNLIRQVDNEDNTMLHLAATPSGQDWNISGAALQLMWHIKWFQYVKGLVPEHFTIKTNKKDKTAGETFKEKHKSLVHNGSEWLKTTSESCSVVAALLAGVSFATSSTVPGGNNSDTGEPALEGKPPFDAFALSSVIGLCFSVTALIMFLSILVSRKEAIDFRIDLPRKLLWGLSSLFLSIVAMFTAFCSGNFFLIDQKYKQIVLPIYTVTCFPVTLYAVLYIELLTGILTKIPTRIDKGEDL